MPPEGSLRVGIAGGGTGGHIEPALNLADELRRRDANSHVVLLGTTKGLESTLVPQRGYPLRLIPPVPLPRRVNKALFAVPVRLRDAVRSAANVIDEERLDVVVGFGGYVSLPVYLAARRRRVPFVVHEANAKAGLANRVGARFTDLVAENYEGSLRHAVRMGCPLRASIAELDRAASRAEGRRFFGLTGNGPVLLAFGGSQGAASVNAALASAVRPLTDHGIQVLHAVGPNRTGATEAPGYRPVEFIDRMDLAYAAADLALCRSGAMTCAELAAVGLPAVYVPYPVGNGEQRFNALPVVAAGGGMIVDDADLSGQLLLDVIVPLMSDPARLAEMGDRAAAYGIRDGGARLADVVERAVVS